jgi:hypothetical protein
MLSTAVVIILHLMFAIFLSSLFYHNFIGYNPKVCISAMFIIVDLQTIFHRQFVGMFMIYFRTKFKMFSSNGSLVISVKL